MSPQKYKGKTRNLERTFQLSRQWLAAPCAQALAGGTRRRAPLDRAHASQLWREARGSARRTEEPRTSEVAPGGAEAEAGTGSEVGGEALQFKTISPTVRTVSTTRAESVAAYAVLSGTVQGNVTRRRRGAVQRGEVLKCYAWLAF